jgi:methyl-accepting chemotaxis protein
MRFIDLKIRTKLYWAFGVLFFVGLLLSANSFYTMWSFENDVAALTEELIPELQLATNISTETQQVAFYMESYLLTGMSENYRKAKAELEHLKQTLVEGEQLLSQSKHLVRLEEKLSVARMLIPKYEQTMLMAFKNNQDITILLSRMEKNHDQMKKQGQEYLEWQNELLNAEIRRNAVSSSRQEKLKRISDGMLGLTLVHEDVSNASNSLDGVSFQKMVERFENLFVELEALRSMAQQAKEKQLVAEIEKELIAYRTSLNSLQEKIDLLQKYSNEHQQLSKELVDNSERLRETGVEHSIQTSERLSGTIAQSMTFNLIVLLVAVVVAILLAIFMARLISKPIYRGIEFAKQMASGDFTNDLDVNQSDEIGELLENLKTMGSQIRDIITGVTMAADNMASASMELSSTSQHVSQGSSEQASSAEEISSSVQEMAANIQQNTQNAKDTAIISSTVESHIVDSKEKVDKTVLAIQEIADKISIIGDIAFQTNILALNASVEAARAGEHGRGFGVVAAEVGKLAERSKIAAQEINVLTKSGVVYASEVGQLMAHIVPEVNKTSKLIQEIAVASVQQSGGADQINSAVQQLNQVTQQNAAASEQLATNAVEMSSQAENLQEIVSFFKVVMEENGRRKKRKQTNTPELKAADEKHKKETKGFLLDLGDEEDDEFEKF